MPVVPVVLLFSPSATMASGGALPKNVTTVTLFALSKPRSLVPENFTFTGAMRYSDGRFFSGCC